VLTNMQHRRYAALLLTTKSGYAPVTDTDCSGYKTAAAAAIFYVHVTHKSSRSWSLLFVQRRPLPPPSLRVAHSRAYPHLEEAPQDSWLAESPPSACCSCGTIFSRRCDIRIGATSTAFTAVASCAAIAAAGCIDEGSTKSMAPSPPPQGRGPCGKASGWYRPPRCVMGDPGMSAAASPPSAGRASFIVRATLSHVEHQPALHAPRGHGTAMRLHTAVHSAH